MTTKRTMEEHMSHVHKWAHKPELDVSVCACGAKAAGVPYTPLTKRTMGQCRGVDGGCWYGADHMWTHKPDCPALYPLQRQPGDEKDALTKLAAHVRTAWDLGRSSTMRLSAQEWEEAAIDLISGAREEHRKTVEARDVAAQAHLAECSEDRNRLRVERDGANERARMLLDAKNDIADGLRRTVATMQDRIAELEFDLAKTMDALLTTQKRMGEVRQQAMQEARKELAEEILAAESWAVAEETLNDIVGGDS